MRENLTMPVPVIGLAIAAKAIALGYGGHVLTAATGVTTRTDLLNHAEHVMKTMLAHGRRESDADIISLKEDLAVLWRGHESGWTETYEMSAFMSVSAKVGWAHTKSTASGMMEAGANIGRHVAESGKRWGERVLAGLKNSSDNDKRPNA